MYAPLKKSYSDINDLVEELFKSGEGSRGGTIVGHTQSGKPVYAESHSAHYKDFKLEDHHDAQNIHIQHQRSLTAEAKKRHIDNSSKIDNHRKETNKHARAQMGTSGKTSSTKADRLKALLAKKD